jgi:hypothetical protein
MCYGCYEQAGLPEPTAAAREVAQILRACDDYSGPLHILIEDWNVEDDDLAFCGNPSEHRRPLYDIERQALVAMRGLTIDQRYAALAVAEGYVT